MNSYTTQPTHNTGRAKPVPEHWAPLISAWLIYLAAIGRPATTINTRRQQLICGLCNVGFHTEALNHRKPPSTQKSG